MIMSDDTGSMDQSPDDPGTISRSPSIDKGKPRLSTKTKAREAPRRLIFTGFSVAGTVAHMAALLARHAVNAQAALGKKKKASRRLVTVRAVSFSAPGCTTAQVASYLQDTGSAKEHINISAEADPVPELATLCAAEHVARQGLEMADHQDAKALAGSVHKIITAAYARLLQKPPPAPQVPVDLSKLSAARTEASSLVQVFDGDGTQLAVASPGQCLLLADKCLTPAPPADNIRRLVAINSRSLGSLDMLALAHVSPLRTCLFEDTDIVPQEREVGLLLQLVPHIALCTVKCVNSGMRADFEVVGTNLDMVVGRSPGQAYLYPRCPSLEVFTDVPRHDTADLATQYVNMCAGAVIQVKVLHCSPKPDTVFFLRTDFADTPEAKISSVSEAETPPVGTMQYARMNNEVLMTAFLRGLLVTLHTPPHQRWWVLHRTPGPSSSHTSLDGAEGSRQIMHPMLAAISELEEILTRPCQSVVQRVVHESMSPEKILLARVEVQPVIETIVTAMSQPVDLEFQHRPVRAMLKVLGGLGMFFGAIFTIIGVVALLPTLVPAIPVVAIMHRNNYEFTWSAAAFGIPAVILAIPGSLISAVGTSIFKHAFDAWADPPSRQYMTMLKTILRIINGDPSCVLEEVPTLETAICEAAAGFLPPGKPLHMAREGEIKECLDGLLLGRDKRDRADPNLYCQMLERSRRDVARWLAAVGRLALIRRHLHSHILISFVGVHNAGKSFWLSKLFGVEAMSSMNDRTEKVELFHLASPSDPNAITTTSDPTDSEAVGELCVDVVDFPGTSDERRAMAMLTEQLACITTLFVCVFKFGHIAGPERSVIDQLQAAGKREYIVLINQTSRFPEFTPDTEHIYRDNYARTLGVPPQVIIFVDGNKSDRVEYVRQELFGCLQLYVSDQQHGLLATSLLHSDVRSALRADPQLAASWDSAMMAVAQAYAQTQVVTVPWIKQQVGQGTTWSRIYEPHLSPSWNLSSPSLLLAEGAACSTYDPDVVEVLLAMGYRQAHVITLLRLCPIPPFVDVEELNSGSLGSGSVAVSRGENTDVNKSTRRKWSITGWVVSMMPSLADTVRRYEEMGFEEAAVLKGIDVLASTPEGKRTWNPESQKLPEPPSVFLDALTDLLLSCQDTPAEKQSTNSGLLVEIPSQHFTDTEMLAILTRNARFKVVEPVDASKGAYAAMGFNESMDTEERVKLFKVALLERRINTKRRTVPVYRDQNGSVVSSLLAAILCLDAEVVKDGIKLSIAKDKAVDAGGVLKSALTDVAAYLRAGNHPMFRPTPSGEVYFSAQGYVDKADAISAYTAIGRLVGICLQNIGECSLPHCFPVAVFRAILGEPLGISDLETLDEDLARGIRSMCLLDAPTFDTLGQTFSVTAPIRPVGWQTAESTPGPQLASFDLAPRGSNTEVTAATRLPFLLGYTWFSLGRCLPLHAFVLGVSQACPRDLLSVFTPAMLQVAVNGAGSIDFAAIRAQSSTLPSEGGPQVDWFYEVAESLPKEDQALLLVFITGSSVPPIGGLSICVKLLPKAAPDALPVSHTCVNMLDLPPYPSKEVLQERLLYAVRNTATTQFGKV